MNLTGHNHLFVFFNSCTHMQFNYVIIKPFFLWHLLRCCFVWGVIDFGRLWTPYSGLNVISDLHCCFRSKRGGLYNKSISFNFELLDTYLTGLNHWKLFTFQYTRTRKQIIMSIKGGGNTKVVFILLWSWWVFTENRTALNHVHLKYSDLKVSSWIHY